MNYNLVKEFKGIKNYDSHLNFETYLSIYLTFNLCITSYKTSIHFHFSTFKWIFHTKQIHSQYITKAKVYRV